jgi:hypothetical protein
VNLIKNSCILDNKAPEMGLCVLLSARYKRAWIGLDILSSKFGVEALEQKFDEVDFDYLNPNRESMI